MRETAGMFSPAEVEVFRYISTDFDESTGTAQFKYGFDDKIEFTETFVFPMSAIALGPAARAALDRALFLLSLAAGISYYKAAAPALARIESGPATDAEIAFLRDLYFHGLGEFSYVNDLSLKGKPQFEYAQLPSREAEAVALERLSLVAVGGGKDSIVSIETLRAGGEPMVLASVNTPRAIVETVAAARMPSTHVVRTLSPELFRINNEGAYNGHVPITAIVSLALTVQAIIAGADTVIMSNERSASVGNLKYDGQEINHQYSKSLQFEQELSMLIATSITPSLNFFSLLRPLSEIDIAQRFAGTERYDNVFTSCNRAFRIDDGRRIDHWCCDCDKCRFVFLALAPFMPVERLKSIFGADLLDDASQVAGFDALIGWKANKPFECVGEVEESVAALLMLSEQDEWKDHLLVKRFVSELLPTMHLALDIKTRPFELSNNHAVPARYLEILNASR